MDTPCDYGDGSQDALPCETGAHSTAMCIHTSSLLCTRQHAKYPQPRFQPLTCFSQVRKTVQPMEVSKKQSASNAELFKVNLSKKKARSGALPGAVCLAIDEFVLIGTVEGFAFFAFLAYSSQAFSSCYGIESSQCECCPHWSIQRSIQRSHFDEATG